MLFVALGCDLFEDNSFTELSNPMKRMFKGRLTYGVGESPYEILSGDFNKDGLNDLVTLNIGDESATVLLAQGSSFAAPVSYDVGPSPRTGAVADLDGNGTLDLVIVNESIDQLTLLYGNGDGTFTDGVVLTLPAGSSPGNVFVYDLNQDGYVDIITANGGNDSISIFTGAEEGEFLEAHSFSVGQRPLGLWAGNLKGGPYADILVANQGSNAVSLLEFDGTQYLPTKLIPCGKSPRFLKVVDLNLDGHLDLIVNNLDQNYLSILLGLGDGEFSQEMHFTFPGPIGRFVVEDFNHDNYPDVVALRFNGAGAARQPAGMFCFAAGNGLGGFEQVQVYGAGWRAIGLVAADMNANQSLDIVTSDLARNTVSVIYSRGDGSFESDQRFNLGTRPGPAVLGDFNADGIKDVAVANRGTNNISILLGEGDGSFTPARPLLLTQSPVVMAVGDLNKDGKDDLVIYLNQQYVVWVYLASDDGAFSAPKAYNLLNSNQGLPPQVMSIALGDMDKDGNLDIVAGNTKRDSVSVLLNNGSGHFPNRVITEVDNFPLAVEVVDVNNDGILDLLLVSSNDPEVPTDAAEPRVARWFGIGDGSFDPETQLRFATGPGPRALRVGDISGNGRPDVVTVHTGKDSLYLLKGVSDTNFAPGTKMIVGEKPTMVALHDLNRDGKKDLIYSLNGGSVVVSLSRGDLAFEGPNNFIITPGAVNLLVADLNGDQFPDLITINAGSEDLSVVLGGAI